MMITAEVLHLLWKTEKDSRLLQTFVGVIRPPLTMFTVATLHHLLQSMIGMTEGPMTGMHHHILLLPGQALVHVPRQGAGKNMIDRLGKYSRLPVIFPLLKNPSVIIPIIVAVLPVPRVTLLTILV